MRFLLDENIPIEASRTLRAAFPPSLHDFDHVLDLDLAGTKDEPLFDEIDSRGYDALITEDRNQLRDHAAALLAHRFHWVAYRAGKKFSGIDALTTKTATIVAAMPHVIRAVAESDQQIFVHLLGVENQASQRMKRIPQSYLEGLARQ